MELGKQIRKVFYPKAGYTYVDADYSQIELRVLAHMSDDENLKKAYNEGKDIHRATAALVFHKPFEEVTENERRSAKAVNFGIVYGISAFGLAEDLGISRSEAKEYIEGYYEAYPKLKEYLDNLIEDAKNTGYALTLFGRRRPTPELSSSNFIQRSFGERVARNSPIQGTAADIIKIAMVKVHDRLIQNGLESRLVLQVHDELLIEAKNEELDTVKKLLVEEMENAVKLNVPLIADLQTGDNWYETH
jgi:DNA polymerase-1